VTYFETLASYVPQMFPGLRWDEYVKKYGSLEAAVRQPDYVSELAALQLSFEPVALVLGINFLALTPADYSEAFNGVQEALVSDVDSVVRSISLGRDVLERPIVIPEQTLRLFLTGQLAILRSSVRLHVDGVLPILGKTPEQIKAHADSLARSYRGLFWLFQNGWLDPLKLKKPLGIAPAIWIGGGVVLGAVVGLCILAWALVSNNAYVEAIAAREAACKRAIDQKSPDATRLCTELLGKESSIQTLPQKLLETVATPVVNILGFCAIAYVGSLLLPIVLDNLSKAFSSRGGRYA